MNLFSRFRQKLIKRYIQMTAVIIFILIALIYTFIGLFVCNNFVAQAHLLAVEETEELNYIINSNGTLMLSLPQEDSSTQKYLNKIFYYMYDGDKLVKSSNNIAWSKSAIEQITANSTLKDGQSEIHFVLTEQKELRFFVISRESIKNDGQYIGKVYAGFDISHNLMFLGRLLLYIILLLLITFFLVNKAANSLANKAMQPIIESFEKQMVFAANASHELRTPLSILMSGLEILKKDTENKLSSFSEEILGDMTSEILKMRSLISNMLLLARCDSSAASSPKAKFLLNDIVEDAAARFRNIISGKNIILQLPSHSAELYACANDKQIEQILCILLDNAVKYTPSGGVIRLKLKGKDNKAIISVENTGLGIKKEDIPHIFDRFYRADSVRRYAGSGLGLSIAKVLAQKNDGILNAASEENMRTTFTLSLPQKP